METAVIACKTIETELGAAMAATGKDYPVLWLESGLHNDPQRLNARLREELGKLRGGRALLAMGFCGNSVNGLRAEGFELVIPRADDCITLLLGGTERRARITRELAAYFLTEGWLRGEQNLWVEYRHTVKKYGEKRAKRISEVMYSHYRTLALVDTGAEPVGPLLESTRIIAETLGFAQEVIPGTLSWLEELLTGPWGEPRFIVKRDGESVNLDDLMPGGHL